MSFPGAVRTLFSEEAAIWGFLSATAIVFVLAPLAARLAPLVGAVDDPSASERPRVHTRPLPRIGGVAIVVGILVPASLFLARPAPAYTGILIGTLLVAALGLVDDVRGLPPSVKLLGVAVIALIPVVAYDVTFRNLTLPLVGDHHLPAWLAYVLTVLWVAFVANLVNLIDGMDALAAGIVAIAAFSFALLAVSFYRTNAAILAAIVCGATLAFVPHNYHPAKIIMGDSGALALGFLLATLAVQGVLKTAATIALVAPLLVMAVPILDTSFVVLKRLKYRRPPWGADHNHFYHRFMRIGFSQRKAAAYLHAWAALLAAAAILVRFVPPRPSGRWDLANSLIVAGVGLLVLAASAWMVYTLEILKARHLRVLGLGRWGTREEEREEAVERAVTAGHR
ncbi:MAG: undecaprenyl/decaprenyl-phosphate alpha-N-acetylglucosaminyl 1-phosphate transferase [Actinomycetota bacterium]|nr:undecaprenyl/decaprenyl-phosphate alpha-N-acetylglucosaminyl 1-phosphate transferase [Actinomycetota bacterium]